MKSVLIISYNMVSHLYATAMLARILNDRDDYLVHFGCPDHAPSISLLETLLPSEVPIMRVGSVSTKRQMNERQVTDPMSRQTLWKALRNPFPLANALNDMFDEQEGMYELLKLLIRSSNYDCVVCIHSACATVCDAIESLKADGVEDVAPCIILNSLPYDPVVQVGGRECWKDTRNLTTFPHVCFYPSRPSSIFSFVSMRFWQALDALLTWRSWKSSERRCNQRRQRRGLLPVSGSFLYYLRKYQCICFGGVKPFGDYSIPSNVICVGTLDDHRSVTRSEGMSIDENLKKWLHDAQDEGVVYVGFGTGTTLTNLEAKAFTGDLLANLQEISTLHPRILWALRSSEIARLEPAITESIGQNPTVQTDTRLEYGSRLRIQANLPQVLLLESPQIKLFISHMGMGGFVEGIAAETPFLCYPSGLDQYYNTRRAMEAGIALRITDLKEISNQVQFVWGNEEIKRCAKRAAQSLRQARGVDCAMKAIERTIMLNKKSERGSLTSKVDATNQFGQLFKLNSERRSYTSRAA